jgi:type I restriction enzyme S subunit
LKSDIALQRIRAVATGSVRVNLKFTMLYEFPINLPDKEVQKEMVKKLDGVKHVISLREQEMQALDDLVKARFVEMFGDPDTNTMGWTERPLSEMLNVLGGYAFKSEGFSEVDGIPVLRIGNINAGFFKPVNMVFWAEDESLDRYIMYPGDLVMSLTGTVGKDDYGNVCILGNDYDKYYLNQRNAKLELKEGLDKYYLSQLLRFEKIKKRLTGISRGVRQANISNKDILNLSVPIPPSDFQLQYAAFVAQVDKSKAVVQKALDEAQILFDSLMQQYFD